MKITNSSVPRTPTFASSVSARLLALWLPRPRPRPKVCRKTSSAIRSAPLRASYEPDFGLVEDDQPEDLVQPLPVPQDPGDGDAGGEQQRGRDGDAAGGDAHAAEPAQRRAEQIDEDDEGEQRENRDRGGRERQRQRGQRRGDQRRRARGRPQAQPLPGVEQEAGEVVGERGRLRERPAEPQVARDAGLALGALIAGVGEQEVADEGDAQVEKPHLPDAEQQREQQGDDHRPIEHLEDRARMPAADLVGDRVGERGVDREVCQLRQVLATERIRPGACQIEVVGAAEHLHLALEERQRDEQDQDADQHERCQRQQPVEHRPAQALPREQALDRDPGDHQQAEEVAGLQADRAVVVHRRAMQQREAHEAGQHHRPRHEREHAAERDQQEARGGHGRRRTLVMSRPRPVAGPSAVRCTSHRGRCAAPFALRRMRSLYLQTTILAKPAPRAGAAGHPLSECGASAGL